MVRILAIGDPHGDLDKIKKIPIKDIDLILLTGDLGKVSLARKLYFDNIKRKEKGLPELDRTSMQEKEIYMENHNSTLSLLKYLSKFAPAYSIAGNVVILTKSDVKKINKKHGVKIPSTKSCIDRMDNVKIVKNRLRLLNGLKIGFLEYFNDICWFKEFKPRDYRKSIQISKKETNRVRKILNNFGKMDVLVCHQPPYGILDKVSSKYNPPSDCIGKHAGSKIILDYIKKHQPRYVFCGHIHEGEGMKRIGRTEVYNLGVAGYKILNID